MRAIASPYSLLLVGVCVACGRGGGAGADHSSPAGAASGGGAVAPAAGASPGGAGGASPGGVGGASANGAGAAVGSWTPEAGAMDSCRLAEGLRSLSARGLQVSSVVVLRHGRVVVDVRPTGDALDVAYDVQSVTKSVLSALVGIALAEGHIPSVDTPILELLPELDVTDPTGEKATITVEHLLTLTSGLAVESGPGVEPFLFEESSAEFILNHAVAAAPGTRWAYTSADTQLLSAILSHRTGMSAAAYADARLFGPLGIAPGGWRADAGGVTVGGFGLTLTARDMARFGQLYLNQGEWRTESGAGVQVVPRDFIAASVQPRVETPWSRGSLGYLWWVKPIGGYCAGGRYGQQINVFPEQDLVVVYTASLPLESADATLDDLTERYILGAIEDYDAAAPECPPPSFEGGGAGGEGPTASCMNQEFAWTLPQGGAPELTQVFGYGDGTTTHCLSEPVPGTFCLEGTAADAGAEYQRWGAGIGLRLADADETGAIIAPFDAIARGVAGVRFTIHGADSAHNGLRVGVTQVDAAGLEYQANPFLDGGGLRPLREDGAHDVTLAAMTQPAWSDLPLGTSLDPSQLHSFRVQVVTQPGAGFDYAFCISDVVWLDGEGNPIER